MVVGSNVNICIRCTYVRGEIPPPLLVPGLGHNVFCSGARTSRSSVSVYEVFASHPG